MDTPTSEATVSLLQCLRHAEGSDIGMRREENQDSYGIVESESLRLYFVADGMGGVKGGAQASQLAVKTIKDCLQSRTNITDQDISSAVHNANNEIFEKGSADPALSGMGTTVVGLAFVPNGLYIINVGDSRAYRVRQNKIRQLTTDHTLVMELLRSGAITPEQAENHPVSHMLTRSLGPTPTVEVDCFLANDGPARDDIYLLCSDGLYNLVHEPEILKILTDLSLDDAQKELIRLANERGGTDNITVILVQVDSAYPVGPEKFPEPDTAHVGDTVELYLSDEELQQEEAPEEIAPEGVSQNGNQNGAGRHGSFADVLGGAKHDGTVLESKVSIEDVGSGDKKKKDSSETDLSTAKTSAFQIPRAWISKHSTRENKHFVGGMLVAAVLSFTAMFAYRYFTSSPKNIEELVQPITNSKEIAAPIVYVAELARVRGDTSLSDFQNSKPEPRLPDITPAVVKGASAPSGEGTTDLSHSLNQDEIDNIRRRRDELQSYLSKLDAQIAAFGKPLSGKVIDDLKASSRESDSLKHELDEIAGELDVATRKLSIWYGRKKRLENTDPINLATEVSVSSAAVKEKREIFERASWEYLKEAEVLRYNPSNSAQDQKVQELARLRKSRLKELVEEVRTTIDKEIAEADKHISELTLRRESTRTKIDSLKKDVEYSQVLMGNDSRAKEAKKLELTKDREIAQSELQDLSQLIPKAPESPAE